MMKKLFSFSGFALLLFNMMLIHGGIVFLAILIEQHNQRIANELADIREMMSAIPVEHTEI